MYKYNWNKKNICNNCGIHGHLFYSCKRPIMSYGIICFRKNIHTDKIEYLLVRRKDSLGYVDLLRGKFNLYNEFCIKQLINEMTKEEIFNIKNCDYEILWEKLWNKKNEKIDHKMIDKFNYIKENKIHLFDISSNWEEPEWGFPKGRRNGTENDYECSVREFQEETGYKLSDLTIVNNLGFVEEIFTGSNAKSYKHKYYICKMNYHSTTCADNYQKDEIGAMEWCSYEECLNKIRNYNYEKISIMHRIHYLINNNI